MKVSDFNKKLLQGSIFIEEEFKKQWLFNSVKCIEGKMIIQINKRTKQVNLISDGKFKVRQGVKWLSESFGSKRSTLASFKLYQHNSKPRVCFQMPLFKLTTLLCGFKPLWKPVTYRVFVAQCTFIVTVHPGYLDIRKAGEILFG